MMIMKMFNMIKGIDYKKDLKAILLALHVYYKNIRYLGLFLAVHTVNLLVQAKK
jgi:hypothetical protein